MAISIQLRIEDREVEDLLAFMQDRYKAMWHSDHIYIMEQAIKILRIADEYETTKDHHCQNVLTLTKGSISLADGQPTDKHL
jgi:hypothetical protein